MFAARVPHARGAWERGSAAALSSRVGALLGSFARRWRTDPDVRQYEQRREAMAALAHVVTGPRALPRESGASRARPRPGPTR